MTSSPREEGIKRHKTMVKYQEGVGDTFWCGITQLKTLLVMLEVKSKGKEIGSWFALVAAGLGEIIQS